MKRILPCDCHAVLPDGKVLSCLSQFSKKGHRGIITKKVTRWRSLNPTLTSKGYRQVVIHGRSIRVNRLVAVNFIPNPVAYPEAQHIDGDKENNSVQNLKWGNQKHNAEDRERHGHSVRGRFSPNAKLTDKKVIEIRRRRPFSTLVSLASKYGVSKKLILLVVQRKIWRHVK